MCGIAGILSRHAPQSPQARARHAQLMTDAVRHRGPDSSGVWMEPQIDLMLGHRRLSIVDLSSAGHQPMSSASGRFQITFNGEIYNFRELRRELIDVGHEFKGQSDTEVLLGAVERWGVPGALNHLTGMFAFGLWDREKRELWLVRDRFGEKPLYYAIQGGVLLFGSEVRALLKSGLFVPTVAAENIPLYLHLNYYPGSRCVFEDMRRLEPGHLARVSLSELRDGTIESIGDIKTEAYWDAAVEFRHAREQPFNGTVDGAADELDTRLANIVQRQMVSDVPIGAFLSGGIDSSLIVAQMAKLSPRRPRTFTIRYREMKFDESSYALKVAEHIGTDHADFEVTPRDVLDVIARIGGIYDEPFADQSQIPTHLVSIAARAHVTVALTGDGGDELFGGYNRHVWGPKFWRLMRSVPRPMRQGLSASLTLLSADTWDRLGLIARHIGLKPLAHNGLGLKMQKLRNCMSAVDERAFYASLVCQRHGSDFDAVGLTQPGHGSNVAPDDLALQMMFWDTVTYLPGDILTKVDRASMAVGLETRAPFLDHTLAKWAWRLPTDLKVNGPVGKHILRRLLSRYLPTNLFERPKQGFGVPIAEWLRGPLKDWAHALLSSRRLFNDGFFAPDQIQRAWALHQAGSADMSHHLWAILMFQTWMEQTLSQDRQRAAA